MKSLFVVIVAVLLPLGFASVTWASEFDVAQVDRLDADALGTQEIGISAEEDTNTEHLDTLSTEINQDVSGDRAGQAQPDDPVTQSVNQFLSLPTGLVIRGTSLGGLVVGGEF